MIIELFTWGMQNIYSKQYFSKASLKALTFIFREMTPISISFSREEALKKSWSAADDP